MPSGALPGSIQYVYDDPSGLDLFGYNLEFYINGGAASGQDPAVGNKKLSLLGFVPQANTWTQVAVPLSALPLNKWGRLANIQIAGSVKETFYIDDIRLEAQKTQERPTAVEESEERILPSGYALSQNYPNPFNPETTISFDLPKATNVTLSIYNVSGQKVATLVSGHQEAGHYRVSWDGRDALGRSVASGVYLYRLKALDRGFEETRRMVLMR